MGRREDVRMMTMVAQEVWGQGHMTWFTQRHRLT